MAARLNPRHSELVLKRIKLAQLVNLLQDNAFGALSNPQKIRYELSEGQIRSATFLIERLLAKANAPQELTGLQGGPILCQVKFVNAA